MISVTVIEDNIKGLLHVGTLLLVGCLFLQHKSERRWLLNVLIDGLKCDEDFILFRKKRVLSQVLSLFSTEILDHASKVSQAPTCCP